METKILEEKVNELFQRKEIFAIITNSITPTKDEAANAIANAIKGDKNAVVVDRILGNYGSQEFKVEAKVYDSIEARNNIDSSKYIEEKAEPNVEEVKSSEVESTEASEEKKEETPVEEKKEESKEEAKE
jgi:ribosomal protein S24E